MTGVRRVGATPIIPTDGQDYTPHSNLLETLPIQTFMEIIPRGPEYIYKDPWLEDDMPPVVLPVDDDTLFTVYRHYNDFEDTNTNYTSLFIRKLTYNPELSVNVSTLYLPGGGAVVGSRAGSPPRGARFDGALGSYASADVDFTWPFGDADDIDIRMLILPDDWTPAEDQVLMEKWLPGDGCFRFTLKANGHLHLQKVDDDGTTVDGVECDVPVDFVPGQPTWVRATYDTFTEQVKYYQDDGAYPGSINWVLVGTPSYVGASGTNMNSAAPVFVGAASGSDLATPTVTRNEFSGIIYTAELWMENNLMFESRFSSRDSGWSAGDSDGDSITITNRNGTDTLTLHGTVEILSVMDLVDEINLQLHNVKAADWTPATRNVLVANDNWEFSIESSGALRLMIAQDGATPTFLSATSSAVTGFANGTGHNLRVTWDIATDVVKFYTSDPDIGPTWSQLGSNQTLSISGVYTSSGDLRIGSATGDTFPFNGTLDRLDLFYDLRIVTPMFSTRIPGTTGFTDDVGVDWVFEGGAEIIDVDSHVDGGFTVTDEVVLWGGKRGDQAVPPLPEGDGWDINYSVVQVLPVDATHVIVRFYDDDGNMDGAPDWNGSVGCSLVEIDWDAKTVEWGPWNILEQVDDTAYESSYADYGLTTRRMVFLPDGRFVHVSTDWDYTAPVLRVGSMNYGTGVATLGARWQHPDILTNTNWIGAYSGVEIHAIDDERVAVFWKNYENVSEPQYPVNVLILDVENDDSLTLVDWAYLSHPDAATEVSFDNPTESATFEQVRPGLFVGSFYMNGGTDYYRELVMVDVNNIVSNTLTWSYLYGTPDSLDPVLYRSQSLWDYDYGYPEFLRITPINRAEGKFILNWQDYTRAIPRTGPGAEYDTTIVELARGFVMEEDGTFATSAAVTVASTSDIGPDFEVRERWLGGLTGGLPAHDVAAMVTAFGHSANYWADPMPDPAYYEYGVLVTMRYLT